MTTAEELVTKLRRIVGNGYAYLATPYSQYPSGVNQAFIDACAAAAWCVKRGIGMFCPIVHTHPIAIYGDIPLKDHGIWLPADQPMMDAAACMLICEMPGWRESHGIQHEMRVFAQANKPVEALPWPLPL